MENWIEFGRGPLFRLCFALMILGLIRTFAFSLFGLIGAYHRAGEKVVPWGDLIKKTFSWLIPIGRIWRARPLYSIISIIWHIGLIIVPLFLAAHVTLWKNSVGFAWFSLPQIWADNLTIVAIISALLLFIGRVSSKEARALSRKQDFWWPPLLALPFFTGYLCSNISLSANGYQVIMLIHLYSANLVMVMIPFTKVAHCVLLPLSQFVSSVGWKFPRGTGEKVMKTLGKDNMKEEIA
ncbi:MAG: hypothetical protein P9L92_16055 [Candidatus Electryonea clarkiae]|nr:hypothetical protein [Candidatus Electryonea clarkiae]MDP8285264.1 hypothetical protein [Candidatus Electryonea clarkiae]